MAIKLENNSIKVKAALNDAIIAALYEAAGAIQGAAQRNSRVDTSQLRGSWSYTVDESAGEATIGSPLENAIWEEFGTGEYAVNGDGRKGGWFYVDAKGHGHFTYGKTPNRALGLAFNSKKAAIEKMFESRLKGMS